jgi:dTDP-4-dehydrorhamnose reductase
MAHSSENIKKRILITGGSGLLGSNLAETARSRFEVYATYFHNRVSIDGVSFIQIDLSNKDEMYKIEQLKPEIIIHCAALTNVDYCEINPDEAYRHNVMASKNIAETASEIGAYLIHISTDSVFDGEKGGYTEEDKPNPLNVYAMTKLQAEREVLAINPRTCVVRTNISHRFLLMICLRY